MPESEVSTELTCPACNTVFEQGRCDQRYCSKRCQKLANTRRRRATAKARLDALKLERGCEMCGYARVAEVLHFDHLPEFDKHASVGHMLQYPWASIVAEIEKCQILCANCHMELTHERRPNPLPYD